MIALDRTKGTQAIRQLAAEARKIISDKRSILIFPEGTRQTVYADESFNRGIFLIYKRLELSVIPVAINSGVFWSPDGYMKYSGTITVSYLEEIPAGLPDSVFMSRLESVIKAEKNRLARELGIDLWIEAEG